MLPVDGTARESPLGGTVSLKRIHDHTYVYTLKRKSLYKRTMTINGDKMKWAEDQELDGGQHEVFESDWARVGHGTGLAGEWKRMSITDPQGEKATETVRVIPNGLAFKYSLSKSEEKIYFDGKEHADDDPDAMKSVSDIATRLDAHSYREIEKRKGEVISTQSCSLSDDENTITCTTIDGHGRKSVIVLERLSR